jgi:hypothetical protein
MRFNAPVKSSFHARRMWDVIRGTWGCELRAVPFAELPLPVRGSAGVGAHLPGPAPVSRTAASSTHTWRAARLRPCAVETSRELRLRIATLLDNCVTDGAGGPCDQGSKPKRQGRPARRGMACHGQRSPQTAVFSNYNDLQTGYPGRSLWTHTQKPRPDPSSSSAR